MDVEKTCSMCNRSTPLEGFSKNSRTRDGLQSRCKECCSTHNKEYMRTCRTEDAQHLSERRSAYYHRHADEISRKNKERYIRDREKRIICDREYRDRNREAIRDRNRRYYSNNKTEISSRARGKKHRVNGYRRRRYQTNPVFRVSLLIRARLRHAVRKLCAKGSYPSLARRKTWDVVGITPIELRERLGIGEGLPSGLHIDHICPLAQGKTVQELERLCHYTNLQLIGEEENLSKSDKITVKGVILCRSLLGRDWIF